LSIKKTPAPSAKKLVRVLKTSTLKKDKKAQRHLSEFQSKKETLVDKKKFVRTQSNLEYEVHFLPGPIGVKLEPVVETNGREVGCRVLRFADAGGVVGQARMSGKIRPGDLLIAIDGRDVISWDYPDIIKLLRKEPPASGRVWRFRSIWGPRQDVTLPKIANARSPEGASHQQNFPLTTHLNECSPNLIGLGLENTASEEVLSSNILTKFEGEEQRRADEKANDELPEEKKFVDTQVDVSMISVAESSVGGRQDSVATMSKTPEDSPTFSPSRVKKLSTAISQERIQSRSASKEKVSGVLSTVYRSVVPAVASSSYHLTSSLGSAMSTKLGEALVGHSSRDFEEAVQFKMQVLTELSQAKAMCDEMEEEKSRLERLISELAGAKQSALLETERLAMALDEQKVCYQSIQSSVKDLESTLTHLRT
jgi:hypothetical protein